jgi:hypothetical protein
MRTILAEATYEIFDDVDFIYKKLGFDKFMEDFNSTDDPELKEAAYRNFKVKSILSQDLPSELAQKANEINPIIIYGKMDFKGNYYNPFDKIIQISPNLNALEYLIDGEIRGLPLSQQKTIVNEITPFRLKASIYHELTHWLDDSLNKQSIYKPVKKTVDSDNPKYKNRYKKDVNMAFYEVNAQIHAIKSLKKDHEDIWDQMTMSDLFNKYTSLNSIFKRLKSQHGEKEVKSWLKDLFSRMHRENLFGKTMLKSSLLDY